MKTPLLLRLTLVLLSALILNAFTPANAASYTWTNTLGGNWNAAANWSPNGVPGATDSAAISTTGNYTVTVNDTESVGTLTLGATSGDGTVQTLNLSGGMLTVNNDSTGTLQGALTVSGATLTGAGSMTMGGPLNWTGGSIYNLVQFNGGSLSGSLNLYGPLVNSGTLVWNANIFMYGGVMTNQGTINVVAGSNLYLENGSPDFDNDGTLNVPGPGTVAITIPFNNHSMVAVSGGTLQISDGGTSSGPFTVASGATLQISGGTFTLGSGSLISGAGNFIVSSGTVNFSGTANVTSGLTLAGGAVNLSGGNPITPASATLSGGTEEGSQPLQITNSGGFTWNGSAIYGLIQFNGGSISGGVNLYGALVNSGTLVWNANVFMYGGLLTNLGTINMTAGSDAYFENGSPDFDNDGQFNVAGSGTSTIGIPFNNHSMVAVSGGTLQISGVGTSSGTFTVASGATLQSSGATFTLDSGSLISGAGNFTVSSGTVNFSGTANVTSGLTLAGGAVNLSGGNPITPASATLSGGTEEGSQPLQVTNSGGFTWNGSAIYGLIQFNGGSISGGVNLYGALVNSGTLVWNANVFMYGGLLTNLGTINMTAGSDAYFETGSPDFDNDGQFNVAGSGASVISIPFNNHSMVAVNSGTLQISGGGTESGSFTAASGGTLIVGGGTFTFDSGSFISGAGNFTVSSGTAALGGTWNVMGVNTFSGGTANVTGVENITNAIVISGGTLNLNGSGTMAPATLMMPSGTEVGSQKLQVTGAGGFAWSGGAIYGTVLFNGGSVNGGLNLYGALVNSGTLAWNANLFFYGGVLTNLGTINLLAGSDAYFETGSPDFDNDGQLNVPGPGVSAISIPFNNAGTVAINSGALSLTGPYNLTDGILSFGISGTNNFGALKLSGNAVLTCTIDATFNGYSPRIGDSFGLITYGSESGVFSVFNLPNNAYWGARYGSTVFSIYVTSLNIPDLSLVVIEPPLLTNGFTVLLLAPIGSNYVIQAASDPALRDWVDVANFTSVDTSFYYTDTTAANRDSRVFRAVMIP